MADRAVVEGKAKYAWYRDLSGYQWFVVSMAAAGWMFDTMAQQLFNLARVPAIRDLMSARTSPAEIARQAGLATMVFMIGWGLGGVLFGTLGDRLGRARTMVLTILGYTIFTGLSLFSTGVLDFNIYRFLCGLGVGGQFGLGVALVAETVPERARPYALGMVQASSVVGNMIAAVIVIVLGQAQQAGAIAHAWRWEFLAGAVPAPLALLILRKLREPEQWVKARAGRNAWVRSAIYSQTPAGGGIHWSE